MKHIFSKQINWKTCCGHIIRAEVNMLTYVHTYSVMKGNYAVCIRLSKHFQ